MDEKKMLDLLRKQAEEIDPPESLSPDAIEQMLAKQKKEKYQSAQDFPDILDLRVMCETFFPDRLLRTRYEQKS